MNFPQLVPPHCAYNANFNFVHDRDFPDSVGKSDDSGELINQISTYYADALPANSKAMEFLGQYHIDDIGLLGSLGVGFSDRTLGKQLPSSDTMEGELLRGMLQRMGLFTAYGGETLRGCLTFPFKDGKGDVVEIFGERFTRWLRPGNPREVIWSLENGGLFNTEAVLNYEQLILCATPLEALMFIRAGFDNVVATMGLRGFTGEQLEELVCSGVSRVLVAFESSSSGDQASRLISQALNASGLECLRLTFPEGCGARQLVPSRGLEALKFVVNGARPCRQSYEAIGRDYYGY